MDELRRKPSRWYYVLAALVFSVGFGMFALLMARQVKTVTGSLTQVLAVGQDLSTHSFAVAVGALVIVSGSAGIAVAIAAMTAIKRKTGQRSGVRTTV